MTTIFDLDYTLLDTVRFKEALADLLGMDVVKFNKSYRENFEEKGINYTLEAHLDALGRDDKKDIIEKFNKMNIGKYFYEKAKEVLLNERINCDKLVLLTFGDEIWQEEKVKRLGEVVELFDEIVYENDKKENSHFLKNLPTDSDIKIINDKFKETKEMFDEIVKSRSGNASGIEVIIVKSKYSEDTQELRNEIKKRCWRYCENIAELSPENKEVEQERKFAIR